MFSRFFAIIITLAALLVPFTPLAQSAQTFTYNTPICRNAANQSPVTSGNWQGGGSFFSQSGLSIDPSTGVINPVASAVGFYTVNYIGGLCACSPSAVIQIVNATPLSVSGITACANNGPSSSTTLSAAPLTFVSYTWSFNAQNTPTTTMLTGAPGPHTLGATDMNGCKTFTAFNVTFFVPNAPTINGSPIVCQGSTITLLASGATTFTWNTGATTSVLPVSPSVNTVYTVSSRDNRGCIGKKSHTVTVLQSPIFTTSNATVCSGLTTTLSVSNVAPSITSFIWMPGSLKGNSVSVSPSQSTTYAVTGNNQGCAVTKNLTVTVLNTFIPSTNFSYSLPLCAGQTGEALPDTTDNFTWGGKFIATAGEGYSTGLPVEEGTGKVNVKLAKAGTYLVTYSIPVTSLAAVGCTAAASNTAIVSIIDSTHLEISPDITITEGESTKLTVSGGDTYVWDPPTALSCTDCAETMAYPSETTTYCVRGISNSCFSSACVNVEVVCHNNNDFSVPTAFTPNNDGLNDQLCLQGWDRCNRGFQVKIYNRWGEKIFESDKTDFCWDGTAGGALLDADVYTYYIKARFFGEAEFVKSGSITLLR